MFPTAVSEVVEMVVKVASGLTLGYLVMRIGMGEYQSSGTVFGATYPTLETAMQRLLAYSVAAAIAGIALGSLMAFVFLRVYYAKHRFVPTQEMLVDSIDARTQNETFKILVKTAVPIILSAFIMNISTTIDAVVIQNVLYNTSKNNSAGLIAQFDPKYATELNSMVQGDIKLHTSLWGCFANALPLMQLVTTVYRRRY